MSERGPSGGVAVVTGAASGLGAAIADALVAAGHQVAGLDLRPSSPPVTGFQVDVTDRSAVAAAFAGVEAEVGPVDVVVTAAGIYEQLDLEKITDERWDRMLQINIGGTATVCGAALPAMIERGRGCIITISSDLGIGGSAGDSHYAATKGAIVGLTRSLAGWAIQHGVVVNTVAPGAADTPMLAADSPWRDPAALSAWPITRLARPDEIAAAVLFLVGSGAALVGQVISPNSGATI